MCTGNLLLVVKGGYCTSVILEVFAFLFYPFYTTNLKGFRLAENRGILHKLRGHEEVIRHLDFVIYTIVGK